MNQLEIQPAGAIVKRHHSNNARTGHVSARAATFCPQEQPITPKFGNRRVQVRSSIAIPQDDRRAPSPNQNFAGVGGGACGTGGHSNTEEHSDSVKSIRSLMQRESRVGSLSSSKNSSRKMDQFNNREPKRSYSQFAPATLRNSKSPVMRSAAMNNSNQAERSARKSVQINVQNIKRDMQMNAQSTQASLSRVIYQNMKNLKGKLLSQTEPNTAATEPLSGASLQIPRQNIDDSSVKSPATAVAPPITSMKELIEEHNPQDRHTNIICTIDDGVEANDPEMLGHMIDAGMNMAQISFDSRKIESHQETLKNLREAISMKKGRKCEVLLDLKGQEIELVKPTAFGKVKFVAGQEFDIVSEKQYSENDLERVSIVSDDDAQQEFALTCPYDEMYKMVCPGQLVTVDNGRLSLKVVGVFEHRVTVQCLDNYEMTAKSLTMAMPDTNADAPLIPEAEMKSLLDFVSKNPEIGFVSLPRVRDVPDVSIMKLRLQSIDADERVKIIAKIQSKEGLQNFESILNMSDGFKVDKCCLNLALTPEKVFIAQKYMTEKAKMAGKLVIASTELCPSEQNDGKQASQDRISMITNAVLDGADYVMLSPGEASIIGQNAIQAIQILSKSCLEAEKLLEYRVDHLRETSVVDLTDETYDYLLQESKNQGIESTNNKDWLVKTILAMSGQSTDGEDLIHTRMAISIFDTFARALTLTSMLSHMVVVAS